ncbi:MAG: IclR family transcriptional regulator [bacterium]
MKTKLNRTVDRAVTMLEILSNNSEGLTLNEICDIMEIPKSSCFDILHTLVNLNMVEGIGRDGKTYRIGVKSFVIGNHYMENKQLVDIARAKIERIGDKYAKSVFLAEDNLGHVVYIYKYQPKISTVVASCKIGTKNDYYNTALGKCMLAFREDHMSQVDNFYEKGLIKDKDRFLQQIIDIRRNRFVYSDQEHQKQLFCIAVPIFDHKSDVSYALSLSGLYNSNSECERERDDLKDIAREISQEIGYIGTY